MDTCDIPIEEILIDIENTRIEIHRLKQDLSRFTQIITEGVKEREVFIDKLEDIVKERNG